MTKKQPNSDTSKRAQKRSEERSVEKAENILAQQRRPAPPGTQVIDMAAVTQRIGALTLERDHWQERAIKAEEMISQFMGRDPGVQEARELAEKAVDEGTPEEPTEKTDA